MFGWAIFPMAIRSSWASRPGVPRRSVSKAIAARLVPVDPGLRRARARVQAGRLLLHLVGLAEQDEDPPAVAGGARDAGEPVGDVGRRLVLEELLLHLVLRR